MQLHLTHPKIWSKLSERNIPIKSKIKIYEKLGGAYRSGVDGGEQIFNKLTEILKYKKNESPEPVGQDHEVSMSMNLLDDIIKNATELKGKIGFEEKDMPAWIQDHISQSQNFLNQANTGYHEYKPSANEK